MYRDKAKRRKYEGVCQALGHSFLPMGFTAWGAMSSGTTELLEKVADAAQPEHRSDTDRRRQMG